MFREFANWFNRLELEKLKLITSNQTSFFYFYPINMTFLYMQFE